MFQNQVSFIEDMVKTAAGASDPTTGRTGTGGTGSGTDTGSTGTGTSAPPPPPMSTSALNAMASSVLNVAGSLLTANNALCK